MKEKKGSENTINQVKEPKKLCPYRSNIGMHGGKILCTCVGERCMGYVDGKCALTEKYIREENDKFVIIERQAEQEAGGSIDDLPF